jgi:hypothetical protein
VQQQQVFIHKESTNLSTTCPELSDYLLIPLAHQAASRDSNAKLEIFLINIINKPSCNDNCN